MMDRNALVTGRIGSVLNVPSNLGGRPQQSPGPGGTTNGEDSIEDHGPHMSEESGPRFTEGHNGSGGLWGFPSQQPLPPGVTMPMIGPSFPIGPLCIQGYGSIISIRVEWWPEGEYFPWEVYRWGRCLHTICICHRRQDLDLSCKVDFRTRSPIQDFRAACVGVLLVDMIKCLLEHLAFDTQRERWNARKEGPLIRIFALRV
jgi:hypothetical protein